MMKQLQSAEEDLTGWAGHLAKLGAACCAPTQDLLAVIPSAARNLLFLRSAHTREIPRCVQNRE